jgi:hypothetical protein
MKNKQKLNSQEINVLANEIYSRLQKLKSEENAKIQKYNDDVCMKIINKSKVLQELYSTSPSYIKSAIKSTYFDKLKKVIYTSSIQLQEIKNKIVLENVFSNGDFDVESFINKMIKHYENK